MLGVTVVILVLALIMVQPLLQEKRWQESLVFFSLVLAALGLLLMDMAMAEPFRISNLVKWIFAPYWQAVKSWLLTI